MEQNFEIQFNYVTYLFTSGLIDIEEYHQLTEIVTDNCWNIPREEGG